MGQVSDDLRSRSKWFAYGPSKSDQTPKGIDSSAEQSCGNPEIEKFESVEQFEWMINPLSNEMHKKVLRLVYIENMTLKEAGEALGYSEPRCCQWRAEAIKELKDYYQWQRSLKMR
jgi:DNA-directed RNA polymerase specialized sigma subunit